MQDTRPTILGADLEGVFLPEIWIAVAEKTGIEELRLTTRDIVDYDQLMNHRINLLDQYGLKLTDIQAVIRTLDPLPGAVEFIDWVRQQTRLIVLTDSFYQFVNPLLAKLHSPTIFAHQLVSNAAQQITGYQLRLPDGKRKCIRAFRELGFRTMAMGDSYNDTAMLGEADLGILFRPPANVIEEFPQFTVTTQYNELQSVITEFVSADD